MTTQPTPTWKHRAPFVALAFITIGLSSWGLFHLFHDFAAMPWGFACLVVGGLDLFAVVCGSFAVMVAGDGDSPVGWNLLLVAYTAAAAYAQFTHAQLAGDPPVIGWLMAAFPLATVLLFEGQLRRAARLQGRARGTVAAPRQRVPLLVWAHFPVETWRANRVAIRALGHLEPEQVTLNKGADAVTTLRRRARPAKAIEPAPNEEVRNGHDRPQTVAARKPSVAAVVRDAKAIHGDNREAVWKVVLDTLGEVPPDTFRKSYNRARANGHEVTV